MAHETKAAVSVDPFIGGGEMAALMRSLDWSQTPVGPVAEWPQSLRAALSRLLTSQQPSCLWWGPELIQFYNDAYRPLLGVKHPQALGQRGEDCWPENGSEREPLVQRVQTGESIWADSGPLFIERNGCVEERYFSCAYSPLWNDDGQINGVFCLCQEETARVLSDRRLQMLRQLSARRTKGQGVEEACQVIADTLSTNPHDIPFALLYLLTGETQAQLTRAIGIAPGTVASPGQIVLQASSPTADIWPLARVSQTQQTEIVDSLANQLDDLLEEGEGTPSAAAVMPLVQSGELQSMGFLILGLSPRLAFNDDYQGFFDLVTTQIETIVGQAKACEVKRSSAEALADSPLSEPAYPNSVLDALPLKERSLPNSSPARILVVDDNGAVRNYVARLLSQYYDVQAVNNGEAALAALCEQVPNLVLSEGRIFKQAGFKLLRTIRADQRLQGLPIVLFSDSAAEAVCREGVDRGANNYITRPFSVRELLAHVEATLKLADMQQEIVHCEQDLRFKAEAAERKVNVILESITDAFVAFDRQWRYTYVNKKATELLNKSREALIGNHVWENVFPERIGVPVYQELQRVLNEKVAAVFEIFDPVLEKWVEAHAYPSADGMSVYFHDISDRKTSEFKQYQAEAELREAHIQLELALLAGAVYTWRWNVPKNRVVVNAAFAKLFGVDPEVAAKEGLPVEVLGQSIHQADRDCVLSAVQHALDTGEVYTAEYRVLSADGQERWVRARGQVEYDAAGQPVSFPGAVIDITERKQAEAERDRLLAQAKAAQEAAESANRVKDEFLAVVSHELRTPLNPILGWSQMLRKRKLPPAKAAYALETIERNAKMQAQLINDLLDVSRILRGKLSLEAASVDLAAVICMALETVRLAADAKSIQIETHFDASVSPVSGDPGRLQQIAWNLLSNAVKFTPEGGSVSVGLVQTGQAAQITVNDTGKGIEPDFLPYVFERFHQADAATTRRFGGLGLGLAIVRSLVELHGGKIKAESPGENQGATFTVTLPVIPRPVTIEPTTLPLESGDLSGIQVLVVDDDENARELMSCLLEMHGADATITASAEEAIASLADHQPDIILSDIGMPEVDGYMLMRQVRALPSEAGGEIPAIALTAYASEIDHRQSAAAGFQQHIAKPIEAEELVGAIARLVNP